MRRLSDRFAEAMRRCASLAELGDSLGRAALELGFSHYALLDHASLTNPGAGFVRIDNYPRAWVEEIVARGYACDDPVHTASRRVSSGFAWRDVGSVIPLESRHRRILSRSRRFGLGEGFTIPANVPGEPGASCSFAVASGNELPRDRLHSAELIGAHALSAARRLRPRRSRARLSRRELQCLRFVAMGKTDWEIAKILGLSIETVHQYVKRARAAYDSVSRTQLVVHALSDGLIGFQDAIPPTG